MLESFIIEESKTKFAEFKDELNRLKLKKIYLGPNNGKGQGIVDFSGGLDFRNWRIDLENKKPVLIGYDQ